ncbi:RpiR family transcriptional regulator [Caballeronia sp. SEWSISQ10-4 2]|uniref:RpiR family transcriptional regulator n=1 Tax=Caballeronia sp. SEWSISQ10-4 2 TaxID=2937438 RepID=UPI002654791B|nr:RpiR family transcriptional regulator [Caballeronia sp. SEWSISQ10-4 2]MDN7177999.1 RpiR family transcriptional regulator [Caballeronia sp. SEWSISQ10-4 2]
MDPLLHTLPESRGLCAFRELFEDTGWRMSVAAGSDHPEDILLSSDHGQAYYAVLKSFNEGRSDRVTALFAQALLEARVRAKKSHVRPAVLIWVGSASRSLVERLVDFHKEYGDGEPIAVLSMDGARYVQFPGLHFFERPDASTSSHRASHSAPPRLVFSDRFQWMLKLLLAVDIKREDLIAADPVRYRTATELARAAGVSTMTATRLLNALKAEGFLESTTFLTIVRRRQLAERWKAEYRKPALALPMKFLSPAAPDEQLRKLLKKETGFLGLFAAAKALGYGHVQGVPPTVWVPNLMAAEDWRPLRRAREAERPDLILQQPSFPQTLQRGVVLRDGVAVTDILQTWLDVSAHPARGAEQAAELEHGILANVIGDSA